MNYLNSVNELFFDSTIFNYFLPSHNISDNLNCIWYEITHEISKVNTTIVICTLGMYNYSCMYSWKYKKNDIIKRKRFLRAQKFENSH